MRLWRDCATTTMLNTKQGFEVQSAGCTALRSCGPMLAVVSLDECSAVQTVIRVTKATARKEMKIGTLRMRLQ